MKKKEDTCDLDLECSEGKIDNQINNIEKKNILKVDPKENHGEKSILLIDRDEFNLYIASNFLKDLGMQVRSCSDIQECLRILGIKDEN